MRGEGRAAAAAGLLGLLGLLELLALLALAPAGRAHSALAPGYTLSGHVQLEEGPALAGVTLSLGGRYSATTDSAGDYTLSGVLSGTYTIVPHYESEDPCTFYHFHPPSRRASVPPDAPGQDFSVLVGHVDPGIFGVVSEAGGNRLAGVTLSATGLPAVTTDADGAFGWWPVACSTYTVTPHKAGYRFTPPAQTVTMPAGGELHFVATVATRHTYFPLITTP